MLVGDFLYSRSFQLMVELDRMEVMRILADTTNQIAEGEVLQLLHVRNPDTDEAAYLRVIERKTAVLFAAATRLGALLAGADAKTCDAMHDYGLHLGYAFQIADDVLDYAADADALGKNLGDDLAEGKATLPLIHAIAHSDAATRAALRNAVEHGDVDAMPQVLAAINATGGLEYSRGRAFEFAQAAEAALDGIAVERRGGCAAGAGALRGFARPLSSHGCLVRRTSRRRSTRIMRSERRVGQFVVNATRRLVRIGQREAMHRAAEVHELPVRASAAFISFSNAGMSPAVPWSSAPLSTSTLAFTVPGLAGVGRRQAAVEGRPRHRRPRRCARVPARSCRRSSNRSRRCAWHPAARPSRSAAPRAPWHARARNVATSAYELLHLRHRVFVGLRAHALAVHVGDQHHVIVAGDVLGLGDRGIGDARPVGHHHHAGTLARVRCRRRRGSR